MPLKKEAILAGFDHCSNTKQLLSIDSSGEQKPEPEHSWEFFINIASYEVRDALSHLIDYFNDKEHHNFYLQIDFDPEPRMRFYFYDEYLSADEKGALFADINLALIQFYTLEHAENTHTYFYLISGRCSLSYSVSDDIEAIQSSTTIDGRQIYSIPSKWAEKQAAYTLPLGVDFMEMTPSQSEKAEDETPSSDIDSIIFQDMPQKSEAINLQIDRITYQLSLLKAYAEKLAVDKDDPIAQGKAKKIVEIEASLTQAKRKFMISENTPETYQEFAQAFEVLKNEDTKNLFSQHRNYIKPIITNILLAVSVIGLVAIGMKLGYGLYQGHRNVNGLFFGGRTEAEEQIEALEACKDGLRNAVELKRS